MQVIITDAWIARSRSIYLSGTRLTLVLGAMALVMMVLAAGFYHLVFLKGARDGWPVVGSLVRLVVRDEFALKDRLMSENLDAMARRLGEMQAKMMQLEALGERVSGLAGLNPAEIKVQPGRGGVSIEGRPLSLNEVKSVMSDLEQVSDLRVDMLSIMESRLMEQKIRSMMVPTQQPVAGHMGSGFGWRIDPFSGHNAMHSGIDFVANVGSPVYAAAGGVVVSQEWMAEYGHVVEIDHGQDLLTRYAHLSRSAVRKGDLVKRGQRIADVGNTGRSTGPHLHFEVLVRGVPQDPQKFLTASRAAAPPKSWTDATPALQAKL
jgi:murein DD-endopeptidase MepM/ murein hydrolase activator NlpD